MVIQTRFREGLGGILLSLETYDDSDEEATSLSDLPNLHDSHHPSLTGLEPLQFLGTIQREFPSALATYTSPFTDDAMAGLRASNRATIEVAINATNRANWAVSNLRVIVRLVVVNEAL